MKQMARVLFMLWMGLWLAIAPVWAGAAQPAPVVSGVRYSSGADLLRVVVDADRPMAADWKVDEANGMLVVSFPGRLGAGAPGNVDLKDDVVGDLKLTALAGKVELRLPLNAASVGKVFSLQGPDRLVIDILKAKDTKLEQTLHEGVTYRFWQRATAKGPVSIYTLEMDPKKARLQAVLSQDQIPGFETVSSMTARTGALAAVNGGYFEPDGEIIGLMKMNQEMVSLSYIPRSAVGIYNDGMVRIGKPDDYVGTVKLPNGMLVAVSGINQERTEDSLILYNHFNGDSTGTNDFGAEYVLVKGKIVKINKDKGNTPIPDEGVVLSVHGKARAAFDGLKIGDAVELKQSLGNLWDRADDVLGAGPMLVQGGQVYVTTKLEKFGNDVAGGRAPRTAIGRTKQGNVLLVVVDGRQQKSIGMTLTEIAILMQELGAEDAMNLDGGGSSEMVVGNEVMNRPSDGRERSVGAVLAVFPKK